MGSPRRADQRADEADEAHEAHEAHKAHEADQSAANLRSIAIVGMGCRFPGDSNSPESFWKLLIGARDGITELPWQRWAAYSGTPESSSAVDRTSKLGGFVADIDGFDASFFGFSPREAALMDPQQRMALEVSWEALEHAGVDPTALAGTDTGVFIGVNSDDHGRRVLEDLPRIDAWTGIGSSLCGIPNRVSHALDLRGPSMAVDTACSASLVALHLACQSLRLDETSVALAGGVMLMAGPALTMVMDAAGVLAPDGRPKAFDAAADGYGRGEGCGILVLRRLADARRRGDRVLAVIRGGAVRQDGRTNGIMAPSPEAQAELMRLACTRSRVPPWSVDYVEAHGTGTQAGDAAEAAALATVYGPTRRAGRPCLIGSAKTNIGHLEAASGVAGVIKVVLALQHGQIPPSLNFSTPNPAIAWDTSGLRVVTEPVLWPRNGAPRRAGVSGYGYGGTIAHLVLEEAPATGATPATGGTRGTRGPDTSTRPRIYPVSGASEAAVREQAGRLADWLSERTEMVPLASVAHTLARRRAHLSRRAAVVAATREELAARLRCLAVGEPVPGVAEGVPLVAPESGAVWVFSGHGSHWSGMGRELLQSHPEFGAVLDDLTPVFLSELGLDPRQALLHGDLGDTGQVQPMTFAIQVALAQVWRQAGVRPAAVIGHSAGEFAAAVTAGTLSLADAATLCCRYARLLRKVARWTYDELAAAAEGMTPSPPQVRGYTTVLTDPREIPAYDGAYWAQNLRNPVRFAQAVRAAADDGHRVFLEVSAHPVVTDSISEVLADAGIGDAAVAHTLRRDQPECTSVLENLALMYCAGVPVDWRKAQPEGTLVDLPSTAWQHHTFQLARQPLADPAGFSRS